MAEIKTDIARLIWHVISINPYLPMSWGIDSETIESDEKSLEFHVQGFLFTGNVRITFIEGTDLFEVAFYNDEDGNLHKRIEDVYQDNLADVIDTNVENDKVGDYDAKIMDFLINS